MPNRATSSYYGSAATVLRLRPKSGRGGSDIGNRIPLCGPCNREKGAERTLRGLVDDNRKSGWTVDSATIRRATYLLWVAHDLERIADRATNIAERVIYLVEGRLVN